MNKPAGQSYFFYLKIISYFRMPIYKTIIKYLVIIFL